MLTFSLATKLIPAAPLRLRVSVPHACSVLDSGVSSGWDLVALLKSLLSLVGGSKADGVLALRGHSLGQETDGYSFICSTDSYEHLLCTSTC